MSFGRIAFGKVGGIVDPLEAGLVGAMGEIKKKSILTPILLDNLPNINNQDFRLHALRLRSDEKHILTPLSEEDTSS
ncbi:MAG: hypothetical protein Q7J80_04685 [Anaerolineales bacterium]|nr:hypothetical protein [Anaerolineales bacterium]